MISLLTILVSFLSFCQAISQEKRQLADPTYNEPKKFIRDTAQAGAYQQKGMLFSESQQYDSGAYYFGLSGALYYQHGLWEKYVKAGAHHVLNLIYLDKIDSASLFNKHLLGIYRQKQLQDTVIYKKLLNFQGGIYSILQELDSAIVITEQLLALDKLFFKGQPDMFLGGTYHNLGTLYTDYEMPHKALQYYDSAEAIYFQLTGKETEEAARLYSNKAIVLKLMGNYDESLAYDLRSYDIFSNTLKQDHPRLALALFNVGSDLIDRNRSEEDLNRAIQYLEQGFAVLKRGNNLSHRYVTDYYRFLAKAYENLEDYEKAIELLKEGLAKSVLINGENNAEQAQMYVALGEICISSGVFDSTEVYLEKSRKIYETTLGSDFRKLAYVYHLKGQLLFNLQQYDMALVNYQKALSYFTADIDTTDFLANPEVTALIPHENLFKILKNKAETLKKAYTAHQQLAYLNASFDTYLLLSDYVQLTRKSFFDNYVKLEYTEKKSDFYEEGVETALMLYEKTKQPKVLEKTWQLADHRKASLLLEALETNKAKMFANVPAALLDRERALKGAIHYSRQRLFELKQAAAKEGDQKTLATLEGKLFNMKADLESLLETIEQRYPAYHRLKYDPDAFALLPLRRKLGHADAVMLQYMVGERNLYVWLTGEHLLDYVQIPKTDTLEIFIRTMLHSLKNRHYELYTANAYKLYQTLLEPVLAKVDKPVEKLIIIPDGILGYLPFESLIQQAPAPGQGYKHLDYLIRDYEISYHYSARLFALNHPASSASDEATFIGFAPSFRDNTDQQLLAFQEAFRSYMDSVQRLPYAEEEVSLIASMMDGKSRIGQAATERSFKQEAADYQIIHLASHSLIDDSDPLNSKLLFDAENDSTEDGLLHTYELYNLQLKADLVCLSACNTGIGKYYQGEGIISLARGFMYAGVPNVMMSLWAVSDRPTKDIMAFFYEGMKEGKSYAEALRMAKLRYLAQADHITANPYYWGAFIFLGQTADHTAFSYTKVWWKVGIVLFLLLVLAGLTWRRSSMDSL